MTVPGPTPTATVVVNQDEGNAKTFNRQASLVGWGWSLSGLGQITMVLAQGVVTSTKAYLGYAGGGFELKQDASNGWQTEPQSFVRIAHEGNMDSGWMSTWWGWVTVPVFAGSCGGTGSASRRCRN